MLGYWAAAEWSSLDPDTEDPLDEAENGTAPGSVFKLCIGFARWARTHRTFLERIGDRLETSQHTGAELVGHNAWLSRAGHGTGFWDRGLGRAGDVAHKLAQDLPELQGYIVEGFVHWDY
jgi:hypothetical protein